MGDTTHANAELAAKQAITDDLSALRGRRDRTDLSYTTLN
jgi:hypothetical protein